MARPKLDEDKIKFWSKGGSGLSFFVWVGREFANQ
jgi:hypothetical protein